MEDLKKEKRVYQAANIFGFLIGTFIVWKVQDIDRKILWSIWSMRCFYSILNYKWRKFETSSIVMIDILLFSGVGYLKVFVALYLHLQLLNVFLSETLDKKGYTTKK